MLGFGSLPSLSAEGLAELREYGSNGQSITQVIGCGKFLAGNIGHGIRQMLNVIIHFSFRRRGARHYAAAVSVFRLIRAGFFCRCISSCHYRSVHHTAGSIIRAAARTVHLIIFHEQILSDFNIDSIIFYVRCRETC